MTILADLAKKIKHFKRTKRKTTEKIDRFSMVHEKGLEPSRQLALVPKTSVSTNSTTRA